MKWFYRLTYSFVKIVVDLTLRPKVHCVLNKCPLGSLCIIFVFYVIQVSLLYRCQHHIAFEVVFA